MADTKRLNTDEVSLDELKRRFDEISKNWPYDTSKPLTDEQLKAEGAVDVTDQHKGLGIIFGKGSKKA